MTANRKPLELIDVASRYQHIRPVPRMPNFAAWIEGVDLTQPLTDPIKTELRRALDDFEVIFFKPQTLTTAQHIALGEVFGPLSGGSYFERHKADPRLEVIENDQARPPAIDAWHTDISWKTHPPLGTAIQITVVPPAGGNTVWSSMSKAFEYLSSGMQTYLEGLEAQHTWEQSDFRDYLGAMDEERLLAAIKAFKPVVHKVVKTHPGSGRKCLYVNSDFTRRIVGVDKRESTAMLQFLFNWIQRPEFLIHHQWEAGGIALWDNRSTQHYACADYWPNRRVNQRVTFDVPGSAQSANVRAAVVGDA